MTVSNWLIRSRDAQANGRYAEAEWWLRRASAAVGLSDCEPGGGVDGLHGKDASGARASISNNLGSVTFLGMVLYF